MKLNILPRSLTQDRQYPLSIATRKIKRRIPVHLGWNFAFQTRAGKARGFLRFWPLWERFTRSVWQLQAIPNAPYGLIEVRFTSYTGKTIDLPGATRIHKGDPIIELHFRNQAFLEIEGHVSAWKYLLLIAQNLKALATWMQEPDFPGDPCAIYGKTLLYRGAPRLGFVLRQRPKNIYTFLDRLFMIGLLVLYHRQGSARLHQGTTYQTYAQEAWISRQEFLKRYFYEDSPLLEER